MVHLERCRCECSIAGTRAAWRRQPMQRASDLQDVAFSGDGLVENRNYEEADEQARDKTRDDDDGKWLLCVGTDAGGKRRREQTEARDESGPHDGAETHERGFVRGFADATAFEAQLVDVADEND